MKLQQLMDDLVFGHLKTRTEGVTVTLPLYDVMLMWIGISTLIEIARKNGADLKQDTQFQELMEIGDRLKVQIQQDLNLALVSTKNPN